MKKLLLAMALTSALTSAQAAAPMLTCLGLKAVAIPLLAGTGYILFRCQPDYYLVKHCVDGEPAYWFASQASRRALAANGDRRCRGPFKAREEAEQMARTNNEQPHDPPFFCAPLGTTNPGINTNALVVWLQHSKDGGAHWPDGTKGASGDNALEIYEDDNFQIGLLPATGTNGMTAEQMHEFKRCDLLLLNPAGLATNAVFRLVTTTLP